VTGTVDYSYSYVGADTIAGAGFVGAERYLGTDGRCLTTWERDELLGAGLGIGLIWETAADRSLDGYWAGWNDAIAANDYADRLGAPGVSIWFATDFHAQPGQIDGPITEYYRGARDVSRRPVRVYGGAPVIDRMAAVLGLGAGWQAAAASWSNYQLSPNACLLQEVQQIWGGAADTNVVLCPDHEIDWLWGRSGGDWLDMASDDDVRRIVREEINSALALFYTGSRPITIPDDPGVYELTFDAEGRRVRRLIPSWDEINAFRYVDAMAEADFLGQTRHVTDPAQVAAIRALPVVHPVGVGTASAETTGHAPDDDAG
jgi:hypothetical protein